MADGIALVGMAGVFPGAPDVQTFWQNIVDGVDSISDAPADRIDPVFFEATTSSAPEHFYCRRGGFIDAETEFDAACFGIMPVDAASAEPEQLLALAVAKQAFADAGYRDGDGMPPRTGVVIGRGGYISPALARLDQQVRTAQQLVECLRELVPQLDDDALVQIKQRFQDALGPTEASIGLVPNLVASRIANRLDLHGPAYTVDAACASSLLALADAQQLLHTGRCDVVLAGGVHHCHDVTLWSVFSQLQALSPTGAIRPFDRRADGLLIGEGTGLVVLKRVVDAERAGDRIYAVIEGVGSSSDGRAASLMSPTVEGELAAVEQAWVDAGMDPATVGLIEAHGTGTPLGDRTELAMINQVFASNGTAAEVGLGSVKSMIGHAMPAAGIAGVIKAALAVHHGVKPPTLHCEEPHPELSGTRFRLVAEPEPWERNGVARRAGVNAFGFGGVNAHVVLQAHASAPDGRGAHGLRRQQHRRTETRGHRDPAFRLFLAEADDAADLLVKLDDEATALAGIDLRDVDRSRARDGVLRLAIADPTPKRLATARRVVERGAAWRGRNDIWFTPRGLLTDGGRIAFAFPGVETTFDPDVHAVIDHFSLSIARGTLDTDLGKQGLSIIWLGRLLAAALRELDVRPDVIVGHSLGEWTAMIESDVVERPIIDEYLGTLATPELPDLVFLAVGCGAEQARHAIEDLADIAVSHDNCPHQAIVCGTPDSVAVAQSRLSSQRVLCQELPFRTGFHTPMFTPYVPRFVDGLARLPLRASRVPLWSAVTAQPFPSDPQGIREVAARLYTEPVRFRELVDNLYATGVRVFVQPGLGSVTGFVEDTLHGRPHLAITAASNARDGMAQLARVAASLWVEGAPVHLARLVEPASPTGATVTPPKRSGAARRNSLRFESRLVRSGLTPLVAISPPANDAVDLGDVPRSGLTDRFTAVLEQVADSGREVVSAITEPARPPAVRTLPAGDGTRVPEPSDATFPAGPAVVERRVLAASDHPSLADHAFYEQAAEWPEPADRFVVVPMTMMIELMADYAQRVLPDQIVVGLDDVRALRWLNVEPSVEVTFEARLIGPGRVRVSIDGYARCVVRFADRYDSPPAPDLAPLTDEAPALHSARELYEQKWMFHGPAYQGVTAVHTCAADGVRGQITRQPAPGGLLDAAGQLLGYWAMLKLPTDRLVLPVRVERIDFYAPMPDVGAVLDCTVRFNHITDTEAGGDIDLVRDGEVWARVQGFIDHRFETTDASFPAMLIPEEYHLADRRDGYWLVREQWQSAAMRELVMRRYFGAAERRQYEALTPNQQRSFLLGRIVLKDAVRQWLAARGAGVLYPAQIVVTNDEDGRPAVSFAGPIGGRPAEAWTPPVVSVSHKDDLAVATVTASGPAGIDVEHLRPWSDSTTGMTMTAHEQSLGATDDPDRWATTVWTVKEAAAKARGTGLQGRPKDIEISETDGAWSRVGELWVHTTQEDGCLVSTVRARR